MALPTVVDAQITDSVTQANVKVLGDAPAMAMGSLYASTMQGMGNVINEARNGGLTAQQVANAMWEAAADQGVTLLYPVEPGQPVTDADVIEYLHGIVARHEGGPAE